MNNKLKKIILSLLVALLAAAYQWVNPEGSSDVAASGGEKTLLEAHSEQRSKVWVELQAKVKNTLPDDNKGSRHQRFIISLSNGHTVLVAHNIDVAPYVPLERGDVVGIRGRFEYNDRGGVLHWTHRDNKGHIKGGWIELDGKRYN